MTETILVIGSNGQIGSELVETLRGDYGDQRETRLFAKHAQGEAEVVMHSYNSSPGATMVLTRDPAHG